VNRILALVFWISLLSLLAFGVAHGEDGGGKGGAPAIAPDFAIPSLDGKVVRLSELLSSVKGVLLNFWGLRCGACLMEMPYLDDLRQKFDGRVAFVGVNSDGVDAATIRKQLSSLGISVGYTLVTDPELRVMDLYQVSGVPMTLLVAPDGKVVYRHENFEEGDEKQIERAIVALVGEKK